MCQNNKKIEEFSKDWWDNLLNEAEHVHDLGEIKVVRPPKTWNLDEPGIKFEKLRVNDILQFSLLNSNSPTGYDIVKQRIDRITTIESNGVRALDSHDIVNGVDHPEKPDGWIGGQIENYYKEFTGENGIREAKKPKSVDPALYQQFLELLPTQLDALARVYGNKEMVSSYLADPAMKDALAKEVLSQMSDHYDQAERMYGPELTNLGKQINGETRSKDKIKIDYRTKNGLTNRELEEIKIIRQTPELTELLSLRKKREEIVAKIKELVEIYGNNSRYIRYFEDDGTYGRVMVDFWDFDEAYKFLNRGKENILDWRVDKDFIKKHINVEIVCLKLLKKYIKDTIKEYYQNKHKSNNPVDHGVLKLKKIYQDDLGGEEILSEIKTLGKVTPEMIMELATKVDFYSIRVNKGWGFTEWLEKYGWKPLSSQLASDWVISLPQSTLQTMYRDLLNLKTSNPMNEIKVVRTKLPGINFGTDSEDEFRENFRKISSFILDKNRKIYPNDYSLAYESTKKENIQYLRKYRQEIVDKWSEFFKKTDISDQSPILKEAFQKMYRRNDYEISISKIEPYTDQVSNTIKNRLVKSFDGNPKQKYDIKAFGGRLMYENRAILTNPGHPYNNFAGIFYENENYIYICELLDYQEVTWYTVKFAKENGVLVESKLDKSSTTKDFIKFACNYLKIKSNGCKVTLTKDKSQTTTYAHYDPESKHIVVYTKNRSIGDILRSLCHELVHHKQNLENNLGPESGNTGSSQENEANSVAGIIMREFGAKYPQIFEAKNTGKELLNEIRVIGNARPEVVDNLLHRFLIHFTAQQFLDLGINVILEKNGFEYDDRHRQSDTIDSFKVLPQSSLNNIYREFLKIKSEYQIDENKIDEIRVINPNKITPEMIIKLDDSVSYKDKLDNEELFDEAVDFYKKYGMRDDEGFGDFLKRIDQSTRNQIYQDLLQFHRKWNLEESLDTYTQQNIAKVIKGFDLEPYPKGFHNAFVTKNAKATPLLAKQINKFLNGTLGVSSIKCFYEPTYQTVNFVVSNDRSKLSEIKVNRPPENLPFNSEAFGKLRIELRDALPGKLIDIRDWGKDKQTANNSGLFNYGSYYRDYVSFNFYVKDLNKDDEKIIDTIINRFCHRHGFIGDGGHRYQYDRIPNVWITLSKEIISSTGRPIDEIKVVKKLHFNYDDLSLYEALTKVSIYLNDYGEEFVLVKPDYYVELFNLGNYYIFPPSGGINYIILLPKNAFQIRKKCNIEDIPSTEEGYSKEKRIQDRKEQFEYVKTFLDKGQYKITYTKDEIPDDLDLTEIKIYGQATPKMVDELIDILIEENKFQYVIDLGLNDKYGRTDFYDYNKWLYSLDRSQLRDLYADLLKIEKMVPNKVEEPEPYQLPFEESFSKEFWKETLDLDEIKVLGTVSVEKVLEFIKIIRGKIIRHPSIKIINLLKSLDQVIIRNKLNPNDKFLFNDLKLCSPQELSELYNDLKQFEKENNLDKLDEIKIHGNVPPTDVYIKLNHDLCKKSPTQRKYDKEIKNWIHAPFEYDDEVRNKYDDEIDKIDRGFLWGDEESWEKLPSDLRRRIYRDMLEFKKKYNL